MRSGNKVRLLGGARLVGRLPCDDTTSGLKLASQRELLVECQGFTSLRFRRLFKDPDCNFILFFVSVVMVAFDSLEIIVC